MQNATPAGATGPHPLGAFKLNQTSKPARELDRSSPGQISSERDSLIHAFNPVVGVIF